MKITRRIIWSLILDGMLLPIANAAPLDKIISLEAAPGYEFFDLCQSLDILCGIDSPSSPSRDSQIFEVERVSGREALSAIMAHNPEHRWEYRKGILSVRPKKANHSSPIDRRTSVHISSKTLTEIAAILNAEMGIGFGSKSVSGSPDDDNSSITLDANNITVRELLDRIVRAHGHSIWILRRQDWAGPEPMYELDLYDYSDRRKTTRPRDRMKEPEPAAPNTGLKIR